jgi:hypothetical protein
MQERVVVAWKQSSHPTVQQHREKWVVRVDGIDTETGRRRPRQIGTFNSRRAAHDFIAAGEVAAERDTVAHVVESRTSGLGIELELNVMPATSDTTAAADFLTVLELLATCPILEEEFAAVSMEIVAIDVEGANLSLVIAGTDATSPAEPIGLTLAAAEVDGHLFMAYVAQDSGNPASGDADLAVKALEVSISRL